MCEYNFALNMTHIIDFTLNSPSLTKHTLSHIYPKILQQTPYPQPPSFEPQVRKSYVPRPSANKDTNASS